MKKHIYAIISLIMGILILYGFIRKDPQDWQTIVYSAFLGIVAMILMVLLVKKFHRKE